MSVYIDEVVMRESFYHIVVNVYVQGMVREAREFDGRLRCRRGRPAAGVFPTRASVVCRCGAAGWVTGWLAGRQAG